MDLREYLLQAMADRKVSLGQIDKFMEDFVGGPYHLLLEDIRKWYAALEATKLANEGFPMEEIRATQGRLAIRRIDPILELKNAVELVKKEAKNGTGQKDGKEI